MSQMKIFRYLFCAIVCGASLLIAFMTACLSNESSGKHAVPEILTAIRFVTKKHLTNATSIVCMLFDTQTA